MVLNDLGRRINAAFSDLGRTPTVDDEAVDALLKSVAGALLASDVNVRYVASLRDRVRNDVKEALNGKNASNMSEAQRKNAVQRAVFNELVRLVDPGGEPAFKPTKGKPGVVMFVGLQGSGKTTSCTKLALWYQKRGFKAGLVCADTFRAGAFDQLKQNAAKARIPFYGSYTETDPVAIAEAGVKSFKKARFDVIIVDTSGRHKQEQELFKEMVQISEVTKPDQTIMVLDASIGQAAEAQSKAFKQAAGYGAILVTKLDGHAKGGGAISAVAATGTPIVFIGTGEHVTDLEPFRAGPFVSKMLGMGDVAGLMDKMQEVSMANPERQQAMMKKISEGGDFTIRDWREQVSNIMSMGPLSKLAGMIPGMGAMLGQENEEEGGQRFKRMMYIMDSMTTEELDSDGHMFYRPVKTRKHPKDEKALTTSDDKGKGVSKGDASAGEKKSKKKKVPVKMTAHALRVAKGSGTSLREVEEFLAQYRMVARMAKKFGGKNSWMRKMQDASKGGLPRPGSMPLPPGMNREQMMQMQNALPPEIKAQLRQPGGREKLLKQLQSGDLPPELANSMGGMGLPGMGAGGMPGLGGLGNMMGGGMPDMGQMQQMMQQMGGMGGMANMMRNMMGGGK